MTAILAGLASIATIFTAAIYAWKRLFPPATAATTDATIVSEEQANFEAAQESGRPQ